MGKHGGYMTAAAISKRMKAKGLGRLRWYCQMCEKQCRDENGFKNHTQSASHQRQLALFSESPSEYISRFSSTFRSEFLLILRRRYGTSKVHANTVYQEYIKDRDHIHMNATRWTTLSAFVMELGREGHCRVENREDGWWVSLIDKDAIERDKVAREMDRDRIAERKYATALLQRQMEMAKKTQVVVEENEHDVSVHDEAAVITMELKGNERGRTVEKYDENDDPFASLGAGNVKKEEGQMQNDGNRKRARSTRWDERKPKGMVQNNKQVVTKDDAENDNVPSKSDSDQPWLLKDIAVKVRNQQVGSGSFAGKKGRVIQVIDQYGARVQMFDSDAVLELDQDDLETVIPKPGGRVCMLREPHRGLLATVTALNVDSYSVHVQLNQSGQHLQHVDYEAVSRHVQSPA